MATIRERLFGAGVAGDSVLTAQLLDALARPGCPICRVRAITTRHHLAALLDERVILPGAHRLLHYSRGFCGEHTWALPPAALAAQSARGAAMLYAPLLADLLRHWPDPARRRRWLVPRRSCPLCRILAGTTTAYLAEFAGLLRRRAIAPSARNAVCLPHLTALAPRIDATTRAALAEATARARRADPPAESLALGVGLRPVDPFPVEPSCPACAAAARAAAAPPPEGLCRIHAWARFVAGRADLARGATPPAPGATCPACRAAATAASAALATRQPSHRLCLGHLRRAQARDWLEADVAYWSLVQLERDLVRFVAGGNAAFTGTLTPDERRSWLVALARFGGEVPGAGLTAGDG